MASPLQETLTYTLVPAAATTVGGLVAALRTPGPRVGSAIEHVAAGVILAAVAAELLPDALHARAPGAIVAGFALGVALMLGLKALTRRLVGRGGDEDDSTDRGTRAAGPWNLIVVAGVDTLIDGILLGIGFVAGAKQGLLLTVALTVETLSLGLSAAIELGAVAASRGRIVATTAALSLLFALGAIAGAGLLGGVAGPALAALLAFGSAVLIYLVTEELLVEAHEAPETAITTTLFFVGFVLLLLVDMSA